MRSVMALLLLVLDGVGHFLMLQKPDESDDGEHAGVEPFFSFAGDLNNAGRR